jgi:hypothetical protein
MFIRMSKDGETLDVHPTTVASHVDAGWSVAPEKPDAAEASEDASPHPLDHDGDGKPGGSLPSDQRGLHELRAEARALGISVDRRWSEARIKRAIAEAQN